MFIVRNTPSRVSTIPFSVSQTKRNDVNVRNRNLSVGLRGTGNILSSTQQYSFMCSISAEKVYCG